LPWFNLLRLRRPGRRSANRGYPERLGDAQFSASHPVATCVLLASFVLCGGLLRDSASAQPQAPNEFPDRVVLSTSSGGRIAQRCRILDYTGRAVTYRTPNATEPVVHAASQVVEVETPQSAVHIRGLRRTAERRWNEAAADLEAALKEESRETGRAWVRREILAQLVRCALAVGDRESARLRFVALVKSDPSTRHFALIPLKWTSEPLSETVRAEARELALDRTEAVRLIADSLLLDDLESGVAARHDLQLLSGATDERVRLLAEVQSWRLRSDKAEKFDDEAARWERRLSSFPEDLRAGGWWLAGRACQARGESDKAARMLLWLPLVYPDDADLAARAGIEAARELGVLGRRTEAATILREVQRRFAEAPATREAAELERRLRATDPDAPPAATDPPAPRRE
jgi:tetratricopeptide (TPR) repeat protein